MPTTENARERQAYRSLLFIPALDKFLAKVEHIEADAVIVDLEDSITEVDKEVALTRASAFFQSYRGSTPCFVRVDRRRMESELRALSSLSSVAGYMIPKMEDPDVLEPYRAALTNKRVIALVETPLGMVRLERVAASDLIDILALGGEDLTCSMDAESAFDTLYYSRSRIVMYAKAFGKLVYDTPSLNYKDIELFRAETRRVVAMGFDGKLAIHPAQVPAIDELFTRCDVEEARKIVALFEQSGQGVFVYNGKVYEKPHVDRLRKLLKSL